MRRVVCTAFLTSALVACSTPDASTCKRYIPDSSSCMLQLARGAGTIAVPAGTSVQPLGRNPDGNQLVLEDSTVVDVWVSEEPDDGLAAAAGTHADSLVRVDTTIAQWPASLTTVKLVQSDAPPVYIGMLVVTLDSLRTVNASVTTSTPDSRDEALRWIIGQLSFTGR